MNDICFGPEKISLYFQVLDKEKKGYLESEELTKYMTQEGKDEHLFWEVKKDIWSKANCPMLFPLLP